MIFSYDLNNILVEIENNFDMIVFSQCSNNPKNYRKKILIFIFKNQYLENIVHAYLHPNFLKKNTSFFEDHVISFRYPSKKTFIYDKPRKCYFYQKNLLLQLHVKCPVTRILYNSL